MTDWRRSAPSGLPLTATQGKADELPKIALADDSSSTYTDGLWLYIFLKILNKINLNAKYNFRIKTNKIIIC